MEEKKSTDSPKAPSRNNREPWKYDDRSGLSDPPACAVVLCDAKGKISYASPDGLDLFGYDQQDVDNGLTIFKTISPGQHARARKELIKVAQKQVIGRGVYTGVRRDGAKLPIEVVAVPTTEERGQFRIGAVIVNMRNSWANHVLREVAEPFRRVFDEGPLGMVMIRTDLTFLRANRAFCTMLGYTENEFGGLGFKDVVHPNDLNESIRQIRRLTKGAISVSRSEERYLRKDDTVAWGSSTITAIRSENGRVLYLLSMVEDITQRKLAEEEVRERDRELQAKSSAIEEANIALRVLLKHKEEDRKILETIIQENISKLVLPQIERMRASRLTDSQKVCLDMIDANLQSVVSPFLRKTTYSHARLTPAEVEVANLIKHGKTSKEIASLLGVSKRTIDSHRDNIRAKLKLAKRNMNLTTYLRSLD